MSKQTASTDHSIVSKAGGAIRETTTSAGQFRDILAHTPSGSSHLLYKHVMNGAPLTMNTKGVRHGVEILVAAANERGLSEDLILSLLTESAQIIETRPSAGGAMTEDQARFLVESGTMTAERLAEVEARVARGDLAARERKTRLSVIADAMSTEEVADMLGIDASSVRHRQSKDQLYSIKVGAKRLYPAWQFTDSTKPAALPHLAAIISAIPKGMHAATVQGFMTTPQRSLHIDDNRVTPRDWLQQGGDKQAVLDILDGYLLS
ncbi:hypothetical protein SAMN06295974_3770 [Plantibacter flavus]|uniref:Uncharacterized protein n=1 Tax=Plantibacter flavus TaxID=150123 RepID=A0A3N2BLP0_9MICO|nr:hypothetical protein [Plantibacter flavus]ROR76082.1 hypothetical protein EDD42_4035 [Plantibacter flavus]SMG48788.1 hypothetical protein SAMN06295974_3770 [Plantibacter flavus]